MCRTTTPMKTKLATIITMAVLLITELAALVPCAEAQIGGIPLWTNLYSGPANDLLDDARAIAMDANGNVAVTGHSLDNSSGSDYLTIKYSGAGVPLWTNRYSSPFNNDDQALAIAADSGGSFLVTGYSTSMGDIDYATIKYSSEGVPLWTNRYNGTASAIAVDRSDTVFVTGRSPGTSGNFDYATIKYSGAGVPLWTNRYNGPGNADDTANALAVDGDGNVFVTGAS